MTQISYVTFDLYWSAIANVTERGGRLLLLPLRIRGPGGETLAETSVRLPPDVLPRPAAVIRSLEGGTIEMKVKNACARIPGDAVYARPPLTIEPWADAVPAAVPGSVHGALQSAGRIPDPKSGRQDSIARDKSFQTWWLRGEEDRTVQPSLPQPDGGGKSCPHRLRPR